MNNDDNIQQILAALLHELQQRNVEVPYDSEAEQKQSDVDSLGRRSRRNYTQRKDVRNYRADYTESDDRLIYDLRAQDWSYQDIGDLIGRSHRAVEQRYYLIRDAL